MPKTSEADIAKIRDVVRQYPKEFSCTPAHELYCKLTNILLRGKKLFNVKQTSTKRPEFSARKCT